MGRFFDKYFVHPVPIEQLSDIKSIYIIKSFFHFIKIKYKLFFVILL